MSKPQEKQHHHDKWEELASHLHLTTWESFKKRTVEEQAKVISIGETLLNSAEKSDPNAYQKIFADVLVSRNVEINDKLGNDFLSNVENRFHSFFSQVQGYQNLFSNTVNQGVEKITDSIARQEASSEIIAITPRSGAIFESFVLEALRDRLPSSCIISDMSNLPGSIKNCKKGDHLISFSDESRFSSNSIVVEAKDDKQFSLKKAKEEIKQAIENRNADIGIFVYSAEAAPKELSEHFTQIDGNYFIKIDPNLEHSTLLLEVAYLAAQTMFKNENLNDQTLDLQEVTRLMNNLVGELEELIDIEKHAKLAQSNINNLIKKIVPKREKLSGLSQKLQEALS